MTGPGSEVLPADGPTVENVLALLREHGGRTTSAKRLLVEVLMASGGHRSAEQLAGQVHSRAPDVHLTTIYRNLDELERLGVVARTYAGHGPATYHLSTAPHGHLVCDACGLIAEVPAAVFGGLVGAVREQYGFTVSPEHLALAGRCVSCIREEAEGG